MAARVRWFKGRSDQKAQIAQDAERVVATLRPHAQLSAPSRVRELVQTLRGSKSRNTRADCLGF